MNRNTYWVVGGFYKNTRFEEFADGHRPERYGPFKTYPDAEQDWQRLSWSQVDNCHVFYRIVDETPVIVDEAAFG